jgi:hypothetical protein
VNVNRARIVTNYTGYVYAVQLQYRTDNNHADAYIIQVDGV